MDYLQKKSIRSVAAAITGFLRHSVRKIGITREKLPSCIALAVCPLVTFYLFEMYTHNPFTTMHFKTQLLNMAFYVLTALLLFGIVKYVRAALMLQTAFFMVAWPKKRACRWCSCAASGSGSSRVPGAYWMPDRPSFYPCFRMPPMSAPIPSTARYFLCSSTVPSLRL